MAIFERPTNHKFWLHSPLFFLFVSLLSLFFAASISSFFLFFSFFFPFSSQAHKKNQETNFSFFVLRCKHQFFFFWPLLMLMLLFWLWWVLEFLRSKTSSFVTMGCSGGFSGGCCDGWDFRSLIWEKHKNKDHGGLD